MAAALQLLGEEEEEGEVAALRAIYCGSGEFQLLSQSDSEGITFLIQTICDHLGKKFLLKITFQLSPEYPLCLPHISICSDHLTRKQCSDIKQSLMRYGETLLSQPMVYELMMWLQHNFQDYMDQSTVDKATESSNSYEVWTSLLQLDHMRAKVKYIKSIEKWTSDLGLTGRLIFVGKLIFILLQGARDDIKKTCKVDVDSSGKKCKERMLSVVHEAKLQPEQQRLTSFAVENLVSVDELLQEFEMMGLSTFLPALQQ